MKHHCIRIFLGCVFFSASAQAATITNLADIPFDLDVVLNGEPQKISIDPNRTWETSELRAEVRVKKRRVTLEPGARYAIWPDGSFTMQDRGPIGRSNK